MSEAPALVRLRVPCADEAEFRRKVSVAEARGCFVPTSVPRQVGQHLLISLEMAGGALVAKMVGEVTELNPGGKQGVRVRPVRPRPADGPTPPPPPRAGALPHPAAAAAPRPHAEPARPPRTGQATVEAADDIPIDLNSEEILPPASSSSTAAPQTTPGGLKAVAQGERGKPLEPYEKVATYQVLARLGGGGMADVYLARSELSEGVDKLVALKTVLPTLGATGQFARMFLDEARIGAGLQHPNVVQVFDFGEAAGRTYLSMEYIHGRDLSTLLKRLRQAAKPPPIGFTVAVGIELAKALEYVHGKKDLDGKPLNLVHRDISPGNVVLSPRGEVKLMDFGVAAAAGNAEEQAGMVIGKLPYMCLQQATGGEPSPGWDVYALGSVLYELLTLKRLSSGKAQDFLATRIPPSQLNPAVPKPLETLVLSAVEPQETLRLPSAAALRKGLEELQSELGSFNVGKLVEDLFGEDLNRQQAEIEQLMGEARRRALADVGPVQRQVRLLKRRFYATKLGAAIERKPALGWALATVVALVLGGAGSVAMQSAARERALVAHLVKAEAQAKAGRLVGPSGDEAVAQLLAAQALSPADPRPKQRLTATAELLEGLGKGALARGDLAEAAAHLQAALTAEPSRAETRRLLEEVEARVKDAARGRTARAH